MAVADTNTKDKSLYTGAENIDAYLPTLKK
jgi:hypothetical protein